MKRGGGGVGGQRVKAQKRVRVDKKRWCRAEKKKNKSRGRGC